MEEGVTSLSSYVFADASKLESITVPASITTMGSGLTKGSSATIYYYKGTFAEQYLNSAKAKIVNETLTSLGEYVPQ